MRSVSRRSFVTDLTKAAAAFTIVPRHVLGRGYRAPSDTLNVACVGVGGMGRTDVTGRRNAIATSARCSMPTARTSMP
jgi:hypothetical protein